MMVPTIWDFWPADPPLRFLRNGDGGISYLEEWDEEMNDWKPYGLPRLPADPPPDWLVSAALEVCGND